jgi:hypothetical protein
MSSSGNNRRTGRSQPADGAAADPVAAIRARIRMVEKMKRQEEEAYRKLMTQKERLRLQLQTELEQVRAEERRLLEEWNPQ